MMPPSSASSGAGRKRMPRACSACAQRKVRCDKMRPRCTRCARAQLPCIYSFGNAPDPNSIATIDETPADLAARMSVSSRLDRLGEIVSGLDEPQQDVSERPQRPPKRRRQEPEHHLELDLDIADNDRGHLYKGAQSKCKYLAPTSFALISEEISAISDLLRQQQRSQLNRPRRSSINMSDVHRQRPPSSDSSTNNGPKQLYGDMFPHLPGWIDRDSKLEGSTNNGSLDDILAELPTREQCDSLIWAYMTGYHTMMPMFHGPTFLHEVRSFQNWLDGAEPDFVLSAHFLSIFLSVLFGGCVVCSRPRLEMLFPGYGLSGYGKEKLASHFYQLAISAIRLSDFPQSPSLHSLSAFIIVDSTWLREEQPLTCCSFVGVAIRAAQVLGLHREPSKLPDMSITEIQVRRQLWWTVVQIDAQVAFASSLPPLIDTRQHNVQQVSEPSSVADEISSSAHNHAFKSILGLFIDGKNHFYNNASQFLHTLHSNRLSKEDVDNLLNITQRIRSDVEVRKAYIDSIRQAPQMETLEANDDTETVSRNESSPVFGQFTKTILSMLAAKPYAIMYGSLKRHNLLSYLRQKEPDFMMNCREYLHRFLLLTQRNDFQPWHWCWPGRHQPLHSIMALIDDLDQFPTSPLAKQTRNLIDLALSMSGEYSDNNGITAHDEDGGPNARPLHDGGHESWKFIRRARDRCWERAGLDPAVFNCPEDANDIHFGQSLDQDVNAVAPSPPLPRDPAFDFLPTSTTAEDWSFLFEELGGGDFGFDNTILQ